jgi:hypothetical protein
MILVDFVRWAFGELIAKFLLENCNMLWAQEVGSWLAFEVASWQEKVGFVVWVVEIV